MFKLIANENLKIYIRVRTWILLGITVAAALAIAIAIKSTPHSAFSGTGWDFTNTASHLSALLIAFIVVTVGDIVASEFSTGSIKMLLTQTTTRARILTSKYIAALLFALFMTVCLYVSSLLIGGIFFGFHGAGTAQTWLNYQHHKYSMSAAGYSLMQYGFLFVQIILMVTIAFMISAIFRSSALAITISILAFLVGDILAAALHHFVWDKFIIFTNLDLSTYVVPGSGPIISGMTMGFSIFMLALYFVVMNILTWWIFIKRDVSFS
ncbi:ABC transporter permease [Alicyclobacillus fastidiosus]|uniref:ABC transporter permease subunit n=1 Tax=Alicyclobacillus fastidiosus TaxID=392011 RepID=A0ABV5AF84_9BACL|nr:ABC transporter permease [Alicyclobacillus fastidiosus]WEH09695.1 ABC transporter permease subunit [Alicyclobacillus fastidiosus]